MLAVLEALTLSTDYLAKKGIESARLNAELFLADILECKRLELYMQFERPLSEDELNKYRAMIARRGKFEPLQYILGYTEFYGYRFELESSVLIPRQETELLVEKIIHDCKTNPKTQILDIGCGSGCISISLAKHLTSSQIIGWDIDETAINVSNSNAKLNEVSNVQFQIRDVLQNHFPAENKFDLIVSNPPYVSMEDYQKTQKEVKDFEPVSAVTDYGNGFKFYERIIDISKQLLIENGALYFELGHHHAEKVKNLMSEKFDQIELLEDYQNIPRVIKGVLK